jgi:hypothetical protein
MGSVGIGSAFISSAPSGGQTDQNGTRVFFQWTMYQISPTPSGSNTSGIIIPAVGGEGFTTGATSTLTTSVGWALRINASVSNNGYGGFCISGAGFQLLANPMFVSKAAMDALPTQAGEGNAYPLVINMDNLTSVGSALDPSTNGTNAGFYCQLNKANWQCFVTIAGVQTQVDSGFAVAVGQGQIFKVVADSTKTQFRFYIASAPTVPDVAVSFKLVATMSFGSLALTTFSQLLAALISTATAGATGKLSFCSLYFDGE